jgi:hypothetical protein
LKKKRKEKLKKKRKEKVPLLISTIKLHNELKGNY